MIFLILITFLQLISRQYQKLYLKNVLLNKKTKKSVVITSTPGKECLAVNLVRLGKKPLRRCGQVGNKDKKLKTRQDKKKTKKFKHIKKKAKKSIVFSSSPEESVTMTLDDSSDLFEFNDENICCICSLLYCKDVENWIKCSCIGVCIAILEMLHAALLVLAKAGRMKLVQMIQQFLNSSTVKTDYYFLKHSQFLFERHYYFFVYV